MAQGEEGSLAGIREGNEGDEFGEMEAGPADGRMTSNSKTKMSKHQGS
jgi:hypothetical protein